MDDFKRIYLKRDSSWEFEQHLMINELEMKHASLLVFYKGRVQKIFIKK